MLACREDLVDDGPGFTVDFFLVPAEDSQGPGYAFKEDVLHPCLEALDAFLICELDDVPGVGGVNEGDVVVSDVDIDDEPR